MMKKIIATVLSLAVISTACIPAASAVLIDNDLEITMFEENKTADTATTTDAASGLTYKIEKDEAVIYGHNNSGITSITIPSTLGGKPVTMIYDYSFRDFKNLKKVVMPNTVTDIGIAVFDDCSALESVTFSNTLKHISVFAFRNCTSLKEVNLPDTVKSLYSGVFQNCSSMKTFHVPASLTFIGEGNLFIGCTSLTKLTFSSSVAMSDYIIDEEKLIPIASNHLYIPPSVTAITVTGNKLTFKNTNTSKFYISGFAGTYAEEFAKAQGVTFLAIEPFAKGDVDNNEIINAIDASLVLGAYASIATGKSSGLDDQQMDAADVNGDEIVNAIDASLILGYYAYTATGGTGSFENFLKK